MKGQNFYWKVRGCLMQAGIETTESPSGNDNIMSASTPISFFPYLEVRMGNGVFVGTIAAPQDLLSDALWGKMLNKYPAIQGSLVIGSDKLSKANPKKIAQILINAIKYYQKMIKITQIPVNAAAIKNALKKVIDEIC